MENSTLVSCSTSSTWLEIFFPYCAVVENAKKSLDEFPGMDPYRELTFSPVKTRTDPYTFYTTDEEGALRLTLSISTVFLENLLHIRDDLLSTSPFYLNGYAKMGLVALLGVSTILFTGFSAIVEIIARLGLAILCVPLLLLSCFTDTSYDQYPLWFVKSALYNVVVIPSGVAAAYAMFSQQDNFESPDAITGVLNKGSSDMEEIIMDRWIKI